MERNIQGEVDRVGKVIPARKVCSSPSMGKDNAEGALSAHGWEGVISTGEQWMSQEEVGVATLKDCLTHGAEL